MDNTERVEAAVALINWCNSQSIAPSDAEAVMYKVLAKIITNRLGYVRVTSAPPSKEDFEQEMLKANEALTHELVTRIYQIHGRKL